MEWLDNMNAERKKEQADRVSYETFEIIMDRLEKDWFDLVRPIIPGSQYLYLNYADRQKTSPSQIWQCRLRIRHAPSATIQRGRTRMRSYFVMGVISPYIKIVMECRIFLKANGYVENAPSRLRHRW